MSEYIELDRGFHPAETDEENNPENIMVRASLGLEYQTSWNDLLKLPRVVILAEPGTGKTEEFQAKTKLLRSSDKPAFFCRIEMLQDRELRKSFGIGTSAEFDSWLSGNQQGYFFLDSVDEARLYNHLAFEKALRNFADAMGASLNRATVIISCRVSEWRAIEDLTLFQGLLPSPDNNEEKRAKEDQTNEKTNYRIYQSKPEKEKNHVIFQMVPLNKGQIHRFISKKGINNADDLVKAIEQADAMIFAERPQDLLDLITYWESKDHLGQHLQMIEFNINQKLEEHKPNRDIQRPLSSNDALYGAERLAAAVTLQKKNVIILPDYPIDSDLGAKSIEPKDILPDWLPDKIQTLLDRAIFDEAIYGTVRFHHRSVREYLTAKWLMRLLDEGLSRRSIENRLFSNRYGCDVVIPSMRPIAAWMAIWDEKVRNHLRSIAPEVLIEYGDPSALPIEFRKSLLVSFTEFYAEHEYTGTGFDVTMVRRLADPQLASTVNNLLKKFADHDDIRNLMLKLIWHGQISGSTDIVHSYIINNTERIYTKLLAIRAFAATGTEEQHSDLVKFLLPDVPNIDSSILEELCESFFPKAMSIEQLLEIIKFSKPPKRYSSSSLKTSVGSIIDSGLSPDMAQQLLCGLHSLITLRPFKEHLNYDISERYPWLLPITAKLAKPFIDNKDKFALDTVVLDIFFLLLTSHDTYTFDRLKKEQIIQSAKAWESFRIRFFWHAVDIERKREKNNKTHLTDWWSAFCLINNFWTPNADDLEHLFKALCNKTLMDDREIALSAIFHIYIEDGRQKKLLERIKRKVAGVKELETKLNEFLHPKPLPERTKEILRLQKHNIQESEKQKKQQENDLLIWIKEIKKNPQEILNVANADGKILQITVDLYHWINEKEDAQQWGLANWKSLIEDFGQEVAENFRDGCIGYWRNHDPFSHSNRRSTTPWACIIGLTGLAMEAENNAGWVKKLTEKEATIAAHYSICELNGLPDWIKELRNEFPDIVDKVIKNELSFELTKVPSENSHAHTLWAVLHSNDVFRELYRGTLLELLKTHDPASEKKLEDALSIILFGQMKTTFRKNVAKLASKKFKTAINKLHKNTWIKALLCVDGVQGYELLEKWILCLPTEKEKRETMVFFCSTFGERRGHNFGYVSPDYKKIDVLSRLVQFIYKFVRVEDDSRHDGGYTPDRRDNAQSTRSELLGHIFNTPGRQSYNALINLSTKIDNTYMKDRMTYLAKERAALDAEHNPWSGENIAQFSKEAEKKPKSERDLFNLALMRLDDLKDDIENGDESDAGLFLTSTKETTVRIYFAGRLKDRSRGKYTVSSEEELADAKKTDIRLHTPGVSPVPIELKIGDNWTIPILRERLENQLIGQYMRVSQYGIFLVVKNKKKNYWINNKKRIYFPELIEMLNQDAVALASKDENVAGLKVVGIDFTCRKEGMPKTFRTLV